MQLVFTAQYKKSSDLLYGRLQTVFPPDMVCKDWQVASGLKTFQDPANCWFRGHGPIPPSIQILAGYKVETNFHYSEKCQSNFYHILPDPIRDQENPNNIRREIGIHFDHGTPGSSGCIVFKNTEEFQAFEKIMLYLRQQGITFVNLIVQYV